MICSNRSGSTESPSRSFQQNVALPPDPPRHSVRSFHRRPLASPDNARSSKGIHGQIDGNAKNGRANYRQHVFADRSEGLDALFAHHHTRFEDFVARSGAGGEVG